MNNVSVAHMDGKAFFIVGGWGPVNDGSLGKALEALL